MLEGEDVKSCGGLRPAPFQLILVPDIPEASHIFSLHKFQILIFEPLMKIASDHYQGIVSIKR